MSKEELLASLERVAVANYGGHYTIMRFTTNWRVGFGTPSERLDIDALAVGSSFEEAAAKALADPAATYRDLDLRSFPTGRPP